MNELRTSTLIAAFEALWVSIQGRHSKVPPVMFAIGEGSNRGPTKAKGVLLGRFAPKRWQPMGADEAAQLHEIFIAGEQLNDAVETLNTVLHEAAHAVAREMGVKDVSRNGRWHNKRFKKIAEGLGLEVGKDPRLGYQNTTVPGGTVEVYRAELDELRAALQVYRLPEPTEPPRPPRAPRPPRPTEDDPAEPGEDDPAEPGEDDAKGRVTLTCACAHPRRLIVSASVWRLGAITCAVCNRPFGR